MLILLHENVVKVLPLTPKEIKTGHRTYWGGDGWSLDSPLKLGWDDSSVLLSTHTVSIFGCTNIFASALLLERFMFTLLSVGLYCVGVLTFISEIYVMH